MSKINEAKALLEAEGFVVLRAKSHANTLERARTDRVLREAAERHEASNMKWVREQEAEHRRLYGRCSYLYGLAKALGATDEQLHDPALDEASP
jgi:hypothetical protein